MRIGLMIAGAASAMFAAVPASAVVTTFATYSAVSTGSNVRLVNSGTSAARTTDAVIYTTSTSTANTPGGALVTFSFLNNALAPFVTNVSAVYTLSAAVAKDSPVLSMGSVLLQPGLSGSFSFLSTSAITVQGTNLATTTYAAGSNLLSGTFTGGTFAGSGTSGSSFASGTIAGGAITFTSDFLNFDNTIFLDRAQSLTAVTPAFGTAANGALSGFRAVAGGQFSADPVPFVVSQVPEPASWAMLVMGFGLVGAVSRRRQKRSVLA